jgi:hypothetical protein
LHKARKLCHRQQWANFVLIEADAADYASQELFDGALFSFSYNTMPNHRSVLLRSGISFVPAAGSSSWTQSYQKVF